MLCPMGGSRLIETSQTYPVWRRVAAWSVHLLTASGAVIGLMAIIAIARHEWWWALVYMGITMFIDSVDGMLARACAVKKVLPHFDGALLDNIVDYFTYVVVPASFLYEAHIVPTGFNLISATLIILASAYQFCQTEAKTEDHCFTGFPSYWNVVVFYLFMFPWPSWINLAVILFLTAGVFLPLKYLYPSRTLHLRPLNLFLASIWSLMLVIALAIYPDRHLGLLYLSFAYVVYYFLFSFYLNLRSVRAAD
jgi:phosphatidylcholine synthase